jgi:hypothetical protein
MTIARKRNAKIKFKDTFKVDFIFFIYTFFCPLGLKDTSSSPPLKKNNFKYFT